MSTPTTSRVRYVTIDGVQVHPKRIVTDRQVRSAGLDPEAAGMTRHTCHTCDGTGRMMQGRWDVVCGRCGYAGFYWVRPEPAARTCTFCGTPHASRERCPIDEYEQGACTCGHPDCGAC